MIGSIQGIEPPATVDGMTTDTELKGQRDLPGKGGNTYAHNHLPHPRRIAPPMLVEGCS